MKLILSLTAVLTLIANLAMATPRDFSDCPFDAIFASRFLRADKDKADHFYSTNPDEINELVTRSGYKAKGVVGSIFHSQERGTIPLYRLYNMALVDHVYTSSVQEKNTLISLGYQDKGTAGYILQSKLCPFHGYTVHPLSRFYSSADTAHLLTADTHKPPTGYEYNGTVGYLIVSPLQ